MARNNQGRKGAAIGGLGFGIAIGVACGVFAIAPNLPGGSTAELEQAREEQQAAVRNLAISEAQAASADSVLSEIAQSSVKGVLQDTAVLVVTTSDADPTDVESAHGMLQAAGAKDAGRIDLTQKFFDQSGADALKTIVVNTLPAGSQLSEDNLDPGTHAGEALGSALLLHPESNQPQAGDAERALLLRALRDAGYLSVKEEGLQPADAVLIITGDSEGTADNANFAAKQLAEFTRALQSRGHGAVLAGRVHTATDTGSIGILRAEKNPDVRDASTVDSIDRQWAQIAAVMALREQLNGGHGDYGAAASAEAAIPALREPTAPKAEEVGAPQQPAPEAPHGEEAPAHS